MKTSFEINNTDDTIDVRDIIERFEELEDAMPEDDAEVKNWTDLHEWMELASLLSDLCGNGGDEQWRGDWYPVALIRDSYFTEYTRDMLVDCGTIPHDLPSWVHIDWDATAREVMMDYSCVTIDRVTYYYR
jgi:hypothetical protein